MLGGVMPFPSELKAGVLQEFKKGVHFDESRFARVSSNARDFCQRLLNPDRKARPFAVDCLNHPWLKEYHTPASSTITETPYEISTPVWLDSWTKNVQKLIIHRNSVIPTTP
jgi:serine/threonine protein kinase